MPKIDEGMFRLEIRLDDHAPAHCHAVCSNGEVKIKITEDSAILYPMSNAPDRTRRLKSHSHKGSGNWGEI